MRNAKLFIVSGGPGAGKTTTLLELAKRGFEFIPEVARLIIQEQVLTGGTALLWVDRAAYTELMLQRSIISFKQHTPAAKPVFADHGIPDTLCYARLVGLRETNRIRSACTHYRYAPLVFLAPPWKEIYKTDTERKQDFAEAEQTYRLMVEVYRETGYETIELPRVTPLDRANFILRSLHSVFKKPNG